MMRFLSRERRSEFWVRSVGLLAILILALWAESGLAEARMADEDRVRERLGGVSIPFVANVGQSDPAVAYYAPTFAGTVFVTRKGELVYSLPVSRASDADVSGRDARVRAKRASGGGWTLTERPVGGRARVTPGERAEAQVNYFIGSDPTRWRRGVPTYEVVGLGQVWPGVDLSLRAHGNDVEKLFTVRPGGDPSAIRMRVGGARSLRVNESGALVVKTGLGEATFTAPVAYQERDNARRAVTVAYRLRGFEYGFSLGDYDPELPLVIDPLLQSTYLGGSGEDIPQALAIHPTSGDVYVAGYLDSTDFPGTAVGAQPASSGGFYDGFVARLNASLTVLTQATYLGGSGTEYARALTIHPSSGDVYVAGETSSTDFPGTAGGVQSVYGGGFYDVFVARLNASLTVLTQATYLGSSSSDYAQALAIHPSSGDVYVAGRTDSTNFPGTAGGAQPAHGGGIDDAFLARLNAPLTGLNQATYLGGSGGWDVADVLAIHPSSGAVYVAGWTDSTDFPGTAGGAQPTSSGGGDAFVARLTADLTVLARATYLGGSGFQAARALAIHPSSGDVYVAGDTLSINFPGTAGGAQPASGGGFDAFVARLNDALTVLGRATYLGGSRGDSGHALAIHPTSGDVYVTGTTASTDFPGAAGAGQPVHRGGFYDAFVARLNASLTTLTQATYLGDIGDEAAMALAIHPSSGEVYVAGSTSSANFPGTAGGGQPVYGGAGDGFVARMTADLRLPAGDFNGDGRSDLVWRNAVTGENKIWFMDGATYVSQATMDAADIGWRMVGTADFGWDGKPDLVWRNAVTGENKIWNMEGPVLAWETTFEREADTNWQIVGTGDFGGDGNPDLVWRNAVTGENEIWNMDGQVLVSGTTFAQEADTNWRIVGTGDFSGDGKPDLVWRNVATGENEIWNMEGPVLVSGTTLERVADTNWQIVAVGDYSGDGKPDLVWRNAVTGENEIWNMDGPVLVSGTTLERVADTNWRIVGPR